MPALRCSIGCESWPNKPEFKTCLVCGEPTRLVSNGRPTMDDEEAQSRLAQARFEAWCEENGRT